MKRTLRQLIKQRAARQAVIAAEEKEEELKIEKETEKVKKELDKLGVKYVHNTGLKKLKLKLKDFKKKNK